MRVEKAGRVLNGLDQSLYAMGRILHDGHDGMMNEMLISMLLDKCISRNAHLGSSVE